MIGFLIFLHATVCVLLTMVVLMQAGRGGGLTEGFASAESMFGARTNEFMVRTTIVLMTLFLTTSLALAYFSAKKEKSLIPPSASTKRLPDITIPVNATVPDGSKQKESANEPELAVNAEAAHSNTPTEIPVSAEPTNSNAAVDNRVQ